MFEKNGKEHLCFKIVSANLAKSIAQAMKRNGADECGLPFRSPIHAHGPYSHVYLYRLTENSDYVDLECSSQ